MTRWIASVELDHRGLDHDDVDVLMDALAAHHPSLGAGPTGRTVATIDIPADSLAQAAATAIAVAEAAGARLGNGVTPVAVDVVTEADRDTREGWTTLPELVGASDAAAMLGVSRQRVQQMAASGQLPHTRVGRDLAIPRAVLEARRDHAG